MLFIFILTCHLRRGGASATRLRRVRGTARRGGLITSRDPTRGRSARNPAAPPRPAHTTRGLVARFNDLSFVVTSHFEDLAKPHVRPERLRCGWTRLFDAYRRAQRGGSFEQTTTVAGQCAGVLSEWSPAVIHSTSHPTTSPRPVLRRNSHASPRGGAATCPRNIPASRAAHSYDDVTNKVFYDGPVGATWGDNTAAPWRARRAPQKFVSFSVGRDHDEALGTVEGV